MLDSQSGRQGARGAENLPRSGRGKRKAGIRDKEIPLDALPKVSSSGQRLTPTPHRHRSAATTWAYGGTCKSLSLYGRVCSWPKL
eukprot:scaffold406959_cov16-Prasinocladus_malaysianus.AAC.1